MRKPSPLAQLTFDLRLRLRRLSSSSGRFGKLFARTAQFLIAPLARAAGRNRTVRANIYGRTLTVPAEHTLPGIIVDFPQYNRPLALALQAIANLSPGASELPVIDIGANVGDTAAILEQQLPGICSYLCIEPDTQMAAMLRSNYADMPRLQVESCFIGEDEGAAVFLLDDGSANPSTKLIDTGTAGMTTTHGSLVRLDTLALPFASAKRGIALIKVDTEGYDFSVLRSGSLLLQQYTPSIFLEWYPRLLLDLNQEPWAGIEFLIQAGYKHFVFFSNVGDFYCRITSPDRLFLRSLADITLKSKSVLYFDVFASTSAAICDELTELGMQQAF